MSDSQKTPRELFADLGNILAEATGGAKDANGRSFLDDALNSVQAAASPHVTSLSDVLKNALKNAPTVDEAEVPAPAWAKAEKPAPKHEAKTAPETKDVFADEVNPLADVAGFLLDGVAHVGSLVTGLFAPATEDYFYDVEVDFDLAPEPAVDIIERKDSIVYRIAVAGAASEDVAVDLDGDQLHVTVSTPKSADVNLGDEPLVSYAEQGIWSGDWEETFYIPSVNIEGRKVEIDAEGITATVTNGLATITVPYKEQVKATIKVG